ncbi:MAG: hypothetical protein HZB80_01280 [Deltaproteobacteria bacterium]|nr:hypothetical protein [Deltaproteobacteria bacterium]
MKIEKTEIWITCERPVEADGTAVRGFFGNIYRNRAEFHGHIGEDLVYKHPLIQYKVFGGTPLVVGLKEGAYLLKALPMLDHLEIYHRKHAIIKQNTVSDIISFGLSENMIRYSFSTPWIGLNEENYQEYVILKSKPADIKVLINRILAGNLLSMSKSLSYVVGDRIQVSSTLKESSIVEIKDGVGLTAFKGKFETNFLIPDFWGIGKFSSRGYGTVKRIDGGVKDL